MTRAAGSQGLFDAVELVKSAAEQSEGVEAWVLHTENNKARFPYLEQVCPTVMCYQYVCSRAGSQRYPDPPSVSLCSRKIRHTMPSLLHPAMRESRLHHNIQ